MAVLARVNSNLLDLELENRGYFMEFHNMYTF
jgi:hypothetical protein